MSLAVLLRNCSHCKRSGYADTSHATSITYVSDSTQISASVERYVLQADSIQINIEKSPNHLALPMGIIEIMDLNTTKPTITITGTVDNVGADTSQTSVAGFENMTQLSISRRVWDDTGVAGSDYVSKAQNYYVPYKNALEDIIYRFKYLLFSQDSGLELEILDATYPRYNTAAEYHGNVSSSAKLTSVTASETGGAVYQVAIQSARFDMDAGQEDRWSYQLKFITDHRKDFKIPAD
tara:strand:- start:23720 stop:24430 length:711 start_codon:yes stop_codon:yes gene_type:complete